MLGLLEQILSIVLSNLGLSRNLVAQITGISTDITDLSNSVAVEHSHYQISTDVHNIAQDSQSITWGFAALHTQLSAIQTAIAALPATGTPVTLPAIPPSGYGPDNAGAAVSVWSYPSALTGQNANDRLDNASIFAVNLSTVEASLTFRGGEFFKTSAAWTNAGGVNGANSAPIFPTASILSTDDLVTFLDRDSFYTGWTLNYDHTASVVVSGAPFQHYTTNITAEQFIQLRDQIFGISSNPEQAPIWPGFANVTFGTTHHVTASTTINEPMDGVEIVITLVPPGTSFFDFHSEVSYRWIGALAFYNDDNSDETPQNLGFSGAIYMPKTMAHASGIDIRLKPGVEMDVFPFTIP